MSGDCILDEGNLRFRFISLAVKYDDWAFYRGQINRLAGGAKAVDFLVLDQNILWLVEVKDYRKHPRTKPTELSQEMAEKVRDTLAGLVCTRFNGRDTSEQTFAQEALKAQRLRVVLHLEQPQKVSRLQPTLINPANLILKMKQILKVVDPHPLVVDQKSKLGKVPWQVESRPEETRPA